MPIWPNWLHFWNIIIMLLVQRSASCSVCIVILRFSESAHYTSKLCLVPWSRKPGRGAQGPLCGALLLLLQASAPSRPLWILQLPPPPDVSQCVNVRPGLLIFLVTGVPAVWPVPSNQSAGTRAVAWWVLRQETSKTKKCICMHIIVQSFSWLTWECWCQENHHRDRLYRRRKENTNEPSQILQQFPIPNKPVKVTGLSDPIHDKS